MWQIQWCWFVFQFHACAVLMSAMCIRIYICVYVCTCLWLVFVYHIFLDNWISPGYLCVSSVLPPLCVCACLIKVSWSGCCCNPCYWYMCTPLSLSCFQKMHCFFLQFVGWLVPQRFPGKTKNQTKNRQKHWEKRKNNHQKTTTTAHNAEKRPKDTNPRPCFASQG